MAGSYKFIDKLTELADVLELMTVELMKNDMEDYQKNVSVLSKLLEVCFPQIIVSYSDPLLKEVSGDAVYWSEQLGRIVESLNQNDKFNKIDVLYQETRTNLIAYIDMIKDCPLAEMQVSEIN